MADGREVKVILFRLHDDNMIVYYLAATSMIAYRFGDANLYWRDNTDQAGFGPFTTLHSLMQHYQNVIAERKTAAKLVLLPPGPSNTIKIDFKSKKRLT